MLRYEGGELPLQGGRILLSTDAVRFPPEFGYGENEDFLKVFVLSYTKFLYDSPLESESPRPIRPTMRFYKRLTSENIVGIISQFSKLADEILSSEYVTGGDTTTGVFIEAMKGTPIFKEYHLWFRTREPELLKYVLSFLRFGKKLNYIDPQLDAVAFRNWQLVEERLSDLEFSDEDTASLRTIVAELVNPLEPNHLLPKFGSGKVSEHHISDVYEKLEFLNTDGKLDYTFFRERPNRGRDEGFGFVRPVTNRSRSRSFSRLKFVPKDISKSRSICMEPNGYMYFQQEVLRWMVDSMSRSPIRRFVNLSDQQSNRAAAVHGSQYLSSDTIDLSSASDSVHVNLVRKVFPKDWLFYMLGTRSSRVAVPGGEVISVSKFAPMGSAVCFPTQCIIFTAVCVYAYMSQAQGRTTGDWIPSRSEVADYLRNGMIERSWRSPFRKDFEAPLVYGDDIICDSRVTNSITTTLERLGFEVNRAKSFTGSQSFRESCGVYAYEGQDVTPRLFRLPYFKRGGLDAKVYASLVSSINDMRDNGYHAVASFWLSLLVGMNRSNANIPFVTNREDFGIYTTNKRRVDLSRLRYNADWQRIEERVLAIGPRKSKSTRPNNLDEYRLDQWWRSKTGESQDLSNMRGSLIRPQETRVVPKWARCE